MLRVKIDGKPFFVIDIQQVVIPTERTADGTLVSVTEVYSSGLVINSSGKLETIRLDGLEFVNE